jgi:hypothetical protein
MTRIATIALAAGFAMAMPVALPTLAPAMAQVPPPPIYTIDDARAVLNARLAALKAVIALSPEQEPLWAPVESAMRDIVRDAAERRNQRISAAPPNDFLHVLAAIADNEMARGRDLRRLVDASAPLAASLTDAQRRRIPAFLGMGDHPGGAQSSAQLWIFEEEED